MIKFRRAGLRGLTLLEVALAISVISFALVGLLALLPTALRTADESAADSRAAQIAGQVVAHLRAQAATPRNLFGQAVTSEGGSAKIFLSADESGTIEPPAPDAPYQVEVSTFVGPELASEVMQLRVGVKRRGAAVNTMFVTFLGPRI